MRNSYYWRVRCRCTRQACRKRVTLRKKPEEYVKPKVCTACGGRLRVDRYRQSKRERRHMRCHCGGRPWKHTRGSPFCKHSESGRMGFTYEQRNSETYRLWRETGVPF